VSQHVLVIGKSGQVAQALSRGAIKSPIAYRFVGRNEVDLADPSSVRAGIDRAKPQLIINAAAYTAVDKAETESTEAYAVNADGPRELAMICADRDIPLIHLSTDYVFDGTKRLPYLPSDVTNPINVYGASKLAGETAVREPNAKHVILRLAWVYSETGSNFVNTMLRLAKAGGELRVVDDQIGQPSYAVDIATAIDKIAARVLSAPTDDIWGTYHLTNTGQTSWFGFAREIFEIGGRFGQPQPLIAPIGTVAYPTPARRPMYSVLDMSSTSASFDISMPDWRDALGRCMAILGGPAFRFQRGATV
jgi:dTDP-4-dehydrorhamnose reductase